MKRGELPVAEVVDKRGLGPGREQRRWPGYHDRDTWVAVPEIAGIVTAIPAMGFSTRADGRRAMLTSMAVASKRSLATFTDLEALGDSVCAEIIGGEIVEKASPTMEHGCAQGALVGHLHRRFNRRSGGRWPGGWWIATEVDVEYETHQIYRHDVVGWRRDRAPERPSGRPVRTLPDWVCEILSPSNEKRDLVDKMRTLYSSGVPHYWILNPEGKVLAVHRHSADGYVVVLTASSGETVCAEPFEDVELRVGVLFGDEDEDE